MWPADRPDLKQRVLIAFVALARRQGRHGAGALFLQMGDRRADRARAAPPSYRAAPHRRRRWRWCSPTMSGASSRPALHQLRDALFARVGQHAVRQLAYRTFLHLHDLSLRFHLERRTGGLSRIIERGTTGIENDRPPRHPEHRADGARVRADRRRSSGTSSASGTSS